MGGGISAATGKLGSAGSGGAGIVTSRGALGLDGGAVSGGDGRSTFGCTVGKVASAGSEGGGISAEPGKLGSVGSGGGSAATAGGLGEIGVPCGCGAACGSGVCDPDGGTGLTLAFDRA